MFKKMSTTTKVIGGIGIGFLSAWVLKKNTCMNPNGGSLINSPSYVQEGINAIKSNAKFSAAAKNNPV